MRQRETPGAAKKAPLVLAYGAWALSTGLPFKGLPPCIGKGLLKKLSREFLVVTVPEHFTSKRCFHCGADCGSHRKVAERDRRKHSNERLELRCHEKLQRAETHSKILGPR